MERGPFHLGPYIQEKEGRYNLVAHLCLGCGVPLLRGRTLCLLCAQKQASTISHPQELLELETTE